MEKICEGLNSWDVQYWLPTLGSNPVERVAHFNNSYDYEMSEAHVLKLENGKYATVIEEGCSCYSSADAQIELHPTKKAAMKRFEQWKKESKRSWV